MRVLGTALAVLILSLATAAETFAARAEMSLVGSKYPFNYSSVLWVTAAPGERNEIVFEVTIDGIRVTDSSPVTPGGFCEPSADNSVICRPDPDYPVKTVRVDAGDLDDSVRAHFDIGTTYLSGGSGDDVLTANDTSPTQFTGGPGDDRMTGGLGVDRFVEDSPDNGSDVMLGGGQPDLDPGLEAFEFGDEVSYAGRVAPVRADLAGDRDDGEAGEGDLIGVDVEDITAGGGADVLIGSAAGNRLNGGDGADLLRGRDGRDRLIGGRSADRLFGGTGRDSLSGGSSGDDLYGGPGWDSVSGGPGRDRIRPDVGYDSVFGGGGNDVLWTRDRVLEEVDCGGGWDRVLADRLEQLKPNCERVRH